MNNRVGEKKKEGKEDEFGLVSDDHTGEEFISV